MVQEPNAVGALTNSKCKTLINVQHIHLNPRLSKMQLQCKPQRESGANDSQQKGGRIASLALMTTVKEAARVRIEYPT